jgi:osmotically-inducible protein OsmY
MSISKFSSPLILALGVLVTAPILDGCQTNQPASSQINDAAITAAVKSKMVANSDVQARNIDVNTENGVVYLLGKVGSVREKSDAERIARETDGVISVVNHLQVGS